MLLLALAAHDDILDSQFLEKFLLLLDFFLPRLIMLVCLVRSFRQFLLSVSFTLFQDFPFSSHSSLIVSILEEPWRKE